MAQREDIIPISGSDYYCKGLSAHIHYSVEEIEALLRNADLLRSADCFIENSVFLIKTGVKLVLDVFFSANYKIFRRKHRVFKGSLKKKKTEIFCLLDQTGGGEGV